LFTFTFPVNLDLFNLSTVSFGSILARIYLKQSTTCRQLGNDTTYDTEKKNPTSHDVADTSAVSGHRVRKSRRHVFKTNCGGHLKKRVFQLSWPPLQPKMITLRLTMWLNCCCSQRLPLLPGGRSEGRGVQ